MDLKSPIAIETGGDLTKDRQMFRFGKRVAGIVLNNGTGSARTFDIRVQHDSQFYVPLGIPGPAHGTRRAIVQDTYFYFRVPANSSETTPGFFADRGLVVGRQSTSNCSAYPLVWGVELGDCTKNNLGNP